MRRGKKYQESDKLIDRHKLYALDEGVEILKKTATANFDETIELHARLGVDSRHADQQVRGVLSLPHGTGREVTIAVFAEGEAAEAAKEAGADIIGSDDLAERIQNENFLDFDVVIATPDMMGTVGRLGQILGPQGLMPNPRSGTVTQDVASAVKDIKAGQIEYRTDKTNIIHVPVGKASFTEDDLKDNIKAIVGELIKMRPASVSGQYLKTISISATMGPGIKLNPTQFQRSE